MIAALFEGLLDLLGYKTARFLVPLVSGGAIEVERFGVGRAFDWTGLKRDAEGRLVLSPNMASLLGGLFWLVMLAIILTAIRAV